MINKNNVYFPLTPGSSESAVESVNGKTGKVVLTNSDVGALSNDTVIPSKTSDLENDSGFITSYTEIDPTVPSWAKESTKPSYAFNEITSKPNTLSGYNITDAATSAQGIKADNAIPTVQKGAPSGVATLNTNGKLTASQFDISNDAYKINLNNLSENTLAAIAGTAPVISTVSDNSITRAKYANNSITYEKLSNLLYTNIENLGDNLISDFSENATENGYIRNDGVPVYGEGIWAKENIRVIPGETYTISNFGYPTISSDRGVFYQENGTFIEAFPNTSTTGETVITAPANAHHCAVNFLGTFINQVKMVKKDGKLPIDKIPTLTAYNSDYLIDGNSNLYDESKAVSGGYYNASGVWTANSNFVSTHLIPVNPGENYVMSNMNSILTFWDSSQSFVSSIPSATMKNLRYVTIPENVAYIRYEFTTNVKYKIILKTKDFPVVFKKIPWNLYDFENEQSGGRYNETGTWVADSLCKTSGFIPVTPGLKYLPSMLTLAGVLGQVVTFWDSNKTFISATTAYSAVTCPANAFYACFTFFASEKIPVIIQGESLPDLFTPKRITSPNLLISKDNLDDEIISTTNMVENLIDGNLNLWDNNNIVVGGYYNGSGVWTADARYNTSHLIPVTPGLPYTASRTNTFVTWWKSDETFLSYNANFTTPGYVIAPENAAYVRFYFQAADVNKQIAQGYTLPRYSVRTPNKILFPELMTTAGLSAKRWVSYGDSITYQNKWQPYIVSEFNLSHTNLGVGSTCIANYGSNPMCGDERLTLVKDANPDIVTILGGANDLVQFGTNTKMGTSAEFAKGLAEKDKSTFYGAYSYIIETLLTWKPTLRIFILGTTWAHNDGTTYSSVYTYTDFSNASKAIAQFYGLPFVDLHGETGFNKFTMTGGGAGIYSADNIHPNDAGAKRIAEVVIGKIKQFNIL